MCEWTTDEPSMTNEWMNEWMNKWMNEWTRNDSVPNYIEWVAKCGSKSERWFFVPHKPNMGGARNFRRKAVFRREAESSGGKLSLPTRRLKYGWYSTITAKKRTKKEHVNFQRGLARSDDGAIAPWPFPCASPEPKMNFTWKIVRSCSCRKPKCKRKFKGQHFEFIYAVLFTDA